MNRLRLLHLALVISLGAVFVGPARACPNCAEATEDKSQEMLARGESTNVALGYSLSIFFMLAVPFSLAGGLGYAIYRINRAETARLEQTDFV